MYAGGDVVIFGGIPGTGLSILLTVTDEPGWMGMCAIIPRVLNMDALLSAKYPGQSMFPVTVLAILHKRGGIGHQRTFDGFQRGPGARRSQQLPQQLSSQSTPLLLGNHAYLELRDLLVVLVGAEARHLQGCTFLQAGEEGFNSHHNGLVTINGQPNAIDAEV